MTQPSPDPSPGPSRRTWAIAGCLIAVAVALALLGIAVRVLFAPEDDTYHRSTDVSATASASDGATAEDLASPAPEDAQEMTSFVTPSGNISCTFADGTVGCTVQDTDYDPAADCDETPFAVQIVDGDVASACGEDFAQSDAQELAYGSSAVSGELACTSESDGLTCWDTRTGHGMTLSRSTYDVF